MTLKPAPTGTIMVIVTHVIVLARKTPARAVSMTSGRSHRERTAEKFADVYGPLRGRDVFAEVLQ